MVPASRGGTICRDFRECRDLITTGLNFDYEGASGSVDLGTNGDVDSGRFDQFRFDDDGRDTTFATVTTTR